MAALARLSPRHMEADFTDDVDGRLSDERDMREILGVFERLAPQEQDVLALCAWGELSYEEASVALGVPIGTIRSRLSRARSHLRELVDDSGHEREDEPVYRGA
jgi:RNA polymerase sigma-70 factor (ECF subfamily)